MPRSGMPGACRNGIVKNQNLSSQAFAMDSQRIFSHNKADDDGKPLWLNEGNIVAHLTQLCGNMAFLPTLKENAMSQRSNRCAAAKPTSVYMGFIPM
jgi:hypothetical protein